MAFPALASVPAIASSVAGSAGASISGLLSAGGSILSGVSGLFGGKGEKDGFYESRRQYDENLKFAKEQFYRGVQARVADAKAAGVHPLAALGISPASGSVSPH